MLQDLLIWNVFLTVLVLFVSLAIFGQYEVR